MLFRSLNKGSPEAILRSKNSEPTSFLVILESVLMY